MATTPRLPNPGGDDGQWGDLLNAFLLVSHDGNGNVLPAALTAAGGVAVTGTPSDGQTLQYNGTSSQWVPATVTSSGSVSDATAGAKGIVQLAGDLGGSSTSAASPKLAATANVTSIISGNTTVAGAAQKASNLSDLSNVTTARTNLGLGTAATQASSAFDAAGAATTVQAASLQKASNLSDVANAATARTNLGLGTASTISATAGGDLSGTLPNPTVAKVNGVSVPASPTSGQVLTATSGTSATWQNPASGFADPTTSKGDIIVHGASTTRLPVGTNGQVLTADSAQANGIKWATPSASSGGGYNSVAKSSAYTASNGDFVVCDSSAGGFIVTLPAATAGGYVRVKKKGTDGNTVSVVPVSGQIDSSNSISVNGQYQSQDFMSDGTLWYQV